MLCIRCPAVVERWLLFIKEPLRALFFTRTAEGSFLQEPLRALFFQEPLRALYKKPLRALWSMTYCT